MYIHVIMLIEESRVLMRLSRIVEGYPVSTKHLSNICTTSAQPLQRWSNIIQMLYNLLYVLGV